ncbi:MAG: GNAT family N-acetyltransferase [Paracoccus sp. (in: a-proteobacteria)]|uniref:GNAT family N-acetyltransferase n=1 Tax=Paracoccus sp. TaxID=267 RepID=UPI0039E46DD6
MKIARSQDLETCRRIRHEVFVIEQSVPEALERDGQDAQAIHLLAQDAQGRPLGTARLLVRDGTGKIGRVAVLAQARGLGIGAAMIRAALEEFRAIPGVSRAKLGAQTHAVGFYERLGFIAQGPEYLEAGIPHRDMVQEL